LILLGKRQEEMKRRDRQDELYREMMRVHAGTVDSFLEQIITETVDSSGGMGARC
jgi:hypothetical protein